MDFRTEITVKESKLKIDLADPIFTIGSCFSDDIGQILLDNKFRVSKNMFGTVYNPISIHTILMHGIKKIYPRENKYLVRDEVFYHYDFHSDWNGDSRQALTTKLNQQIQYVNKAITNCKILIITYGTGWVYAEKSLGEIVANCHKVPQINFEKFLLSQKRIIESFQQFHGELKKVNNDVRLILTVSPVRHLKDTMELNAVSKAVLRLACHSLTETYPDVEYFPSYEIMMDDLRDYRFYKPDLIHPSNVAVEYIWEKFFNAFINESSKSFIKEWAKIRLALEHQPFQPGSKTHQQFLRDTLDKLYNLKDKIDVSNEIRLLREQVH